MPAEKAPRLSLAARPAGSPRTCCFGQPTSACTLQHIRTTLRAALNAAIREGLITDNPARRLELPTRKRAHALVWTEQRVTDWEQSGTRPAVAVWTPQQP